MELQENASARSDGASSSDEVDLNDKTRIGKFTWADKKEECMAGQHEEEQWFVSV